MFTGKARAGGGEPGPAARGGTPVSKEQEAEKETTEKEKDGGAFELTPCCDLFRPLQELCAYQEGLSL